MLDACVMTLVRNGDDYIEPVLRVLLPHVPTVRVSVDRRSNDNTWNILERLSKEFHQLQVSSFTVKDPLTDLVAARNKLLEGFVETWGFIVDSDEYHYDIGRYKLTGGNAYAISSHAIWDSKRGHKASSRAIAGRIFRNSAQNTGTLEWRGKFGKEVLYRGDKPAFDEARVLQRKYIHFTHLKKDQWRYELNQARIADGKHLYPLPPEIIQIVKNIHGNRTN